MDAIYALDHVWEQRTRRAIEQRCQLELQRSQNIAGSLSDLSEYEWKPIYQTRKEPAETNIEISTNMQEILVRSWHLADLISHAKSCILTHTDSARLSFYDRCMKGLVIGRQVLVLGSGTGGILSILAASHNASSVLCYEINQIGYELSRSVLHDNQAFSQKITLKRWDPNDPVAFGEDVVVIVDFWAAEASISRVLRAYSPLIQQQISSTVFIPSHISLNTQLLCISSPDSEGVKLSEAVRVLRWLPDDREMIDLTTMFPKGLVTAVSDPLKLFNLSILDAAIDTSLDSLPKELFEVPLKKSVHSISHSATWTSFAFEQPHQIEIIAHSQKAHLQHLDTMMGPFGHTAKALLSGDRYGKSRLQLLGVKSGDQAGISVNGGLGKPRFSLLPRWIWREMEKTERYTSYSIAIARTISSFMDNASNKGTSSPTPHILCIGSLSSIGSIACHAALSGAQVTCHSQSVDLLSRVVALNNLHSKVKIKKDLHSISPADILVLESFDVGLLGEGCLIQLARAREAGLISAETVIIPSRAVVFAALASVKVKDYRKEGQDTVDFSSLNATDRLLTADGYSSLDLSSSHHHTITFLSEPMVVFDSINFKASTEELMEIVEKSLKFKVTEEGESLTCNAVISWFSTFSGGEELFSSGPSHTDTEVAVHHLQLPTSRFVRGQEVVVEAHRDPEGISFKINSAAAGSSSSHCQPAAVYFQEIKKHQEALRNALSQFSIMDPAESRQLASLANDLSSSSPAAATFLERFMSS